MNDPHLSDEWVLTAGHCCTSGKRSRDPYSTSSISGLRKRMFTIYKYIFIPRVNLFWYGKCIYICFYIKLFFNKVTVGTPFDPLCADNLTCNSQRVDTTRGEILSISEIIIHENYKFTNQGIDKDVCLLKIPSLKCRPHTKIEILSKKPAADEKCDVLGWGTTKQGFQSTKIRSAQVLVSPVDKNITRN